MTKVSRKGSDAVARKAAMVKHALDKAISAIVENPAEFVVNPGKDFVCVKMFSVKKTPVSKI